MLNNFFPENSAVYEIMLAKYRTPREATDDYNMARAHWIVGN